MMKRIFVLLAMMAAFSFCRGANSSFIFQRNSTAQQFFSVSQSREKKPNILVQLIRKKFRHTKRALATALAFPLPFGILALHRIYLGTKPYVPVVYIGTLGGVFGILPFIDFCVLLFDKDIDRYMNNGKVFMWIN